MPRRVVRRIGGPPFFEELEPRLLLAADWTFMVYLDADNNLEGAGIDDVNEMETVGSSSLLNVVLQIDRISGYDSSNGNWTDTRRGLVVQDANTSVISSTLTSIGEANMGSAPVLTAFAQWAIATYPADHYALVLWDHGGGTSGVCWDDTDSDHLTAAEVGAALASIGTHIDIIGFDACLMGMLETAYEVHADADVIVASEQTEPWDGWPYDTLLAALAADTTQSAAELASAITTAYGLSYGGAETLSAIDLTGVAALASALDTFADTVMTEDADWAAISTARSQADYFTDSDFRDLGTFIDGVVNTAANPNVLASATALQSAYASVVIANHSGPGEGATGLSVYLPPAGGSVFSSYTAANFGLLADTRWDEFLGSFTGSGGGGGGTDLDGDISNANSAGTLPATLTGNVGIDTPEVVGGRDVNFYAVTVGAGDVIGFDIDAEEDGSWLDSILRLFDATGRELDWNDDAYDPDSDVYTYDSYIEYTFAKAETVYIAVSGYSNFSYNPLVSLSGSSGSEGPYTLLIRRLSGGTPDSDGTIPTARALGSAPSVYSAAIGDEAIGDKDVDFYAVDVESNQALTFSVVAGGSGLNAYLKLFTADGTLLAEDDDTNGLDPQIDYDFSAVGAGTYYVAVSGSPNTTYDPFVAGLGTSGSIGSYTLSVAGFSVHLDFNGTIPQAVLLGAAPVDLTGAIGDEPSGSLDVDFFALDAAAGVMFGFDIDAWELAYDLDAELRLFDITGTVLASSYDGTDPDTAVPSIDPYIQYVFSTPGRYYIAVSGAANHGYEPFVETSGIPGDTGPYELHIRTVGSGLDPNGTIPTATAVGTIPTVLHGAVGDEAASDLDVDFYAVTVSAGQRLCFDIDAEEDGSWLDSMLRLFDASGTELASNDDAEDPDTGWWSYDSCIEYEFTAGGTYYIAVSGYSNDWYDPFVVLSGYAGSTGEYDLVITRSGESAEVVARNADGEWYAWVWEGTYFYDYYLEGSALWSSAVPWLNVMTADINGDGLDDVVGRNAYGHWWACVSDDYWFDSVYLGGSSLWSASVPWLEVLPADVNGDGMTDVIARNAYGHWWACISNGSTFSNRLMMNSWLWSSSVPWLNVMTADVNGDGNMDVLGRNAYGHWWACVSDGTTFGARLMMNSWLWSSSVPWLNVLAADVNGDGNMDVVGRNAYGHWWACVSDGTTFGARLMMNSWLWSSSVPWANVLASDVNGDGNMDVIGRNAYGHWWACVSDGTTFSNRLMINSSLWSWAVLWLNVVSVDVNGDALDDVVGRNAAEDWWACISNGAAFSNRYMGSWSWATWLNVLAADVCSNDDGYYLTGRTTGRDGWSGLAEGSGLSDRQPLDSSLPERDDSQRPDVSLAPSDDVTRTRADAPEENGFILEADQLALMPAPGAQSDTSPANAESRRRTVAAAPNAAGWRDDDLLNMLVLPQVLIPLSD